MTQLCNCRHASECQSALVRRTGGKTFNLCQTDPKYRTVLLQDSRTADPVPSVTHGGVGYFLKLRIADIVKIKPDSGCGCSTYATQLDRWGPDKCESRIDEIVATLTDEKHRQLIIDNLDLHPAAVNSIFGVWILRAATRNIVRKAITDAKEAATKAKTKPPRRIHHTGPQYKHSPTIPPEPIPFTGPPQITLLFHVWPHGDGWRRHVEKLQPILPQCSRKILGIAYDATTATVDETKAAFGPGWEHVIVKNEPGGKGRRGLREVATYNRMLPRLSDGVNDVTLCLHGKGAQDHTAASEAITWWIDAMYETVAYNMPQVVDEMRSGAAIVGSFRRLGRHFRTRHGWHYSGTYYAFRNAIALGNGVPVLRQMWWGTESWPGDYFPLSSSACIFADNCGDLYKAENQPREELDAWRAKRC